MVIGVLELDIRLFSPNSLKDKRSIIKRLISRIRNTFNVSVSEIGYQDLWQRALVGVALITTEKSFAQRVLSPQGAQHSEAAWRICSPLNNERYLLPTFRPLHSQVVV